MPDADQRTPGRPTPSPAPAGSGRRLWLLRACGLAGILALALHVAHGHFGLGGHWLDTFSDDWLYDGIILGGAVSCLARGVFVRSERAAWLLLGAGLALDASGEIYYSFAFGDVSNPPIPSIADLLYLLY